MLGVSGNVFMMIFTIVECVVYGDCKSLRHGPCSFVGRLFSVSCGFPP